MSALSRSPLRNSSYSNNRLLTYFGVKNDQSSELFDQYVARSSPFRTSLGGDHNNMTTSPPASFLNITHEEANKLI